MPYIKNHTNRREELDWNSPAQNAGELNYQIFSYIKACIDSKQIPLEINVKMYVDNFLGTKPNYQKYNDMTGCLVRCLKEVKRRFDFNCTTILIKIMESYDQQIADYEDEKIIENGDV